MQKILITTVSIMLVLIGAIANANAKRNCISIENKNSSSLEVYQRTGMARSSLILIIKSGQVKGLCPLYGQQVIFKIRLGGVSKKIYRRIYKPGKIVCKSRLRKNFVALLGPVVAKCFYKK